MKRPAEHGVTIYTVLVMQGSQSLLQNCATDANKFSTCSPRVSW